MNFVTAGVIDQYTTLFVTDWHASANATKAIGAWVHNKGGSLMTTSGGMLRDEYNQVNAAATELLGIIEAGYKNEEQPLGVIKQD